MREAIRQSLENLRANTLRSVLTMFGILWGIVSIVVLSAMGEGFRRGNDAVLREFGRNIGIVWGGRTSMQAGGERAGRVIRLTVDDARAIERQARLVSTLSPEINRGGVQVKSRYNAAAVSVHGIEPPYQDIRTIELQYGRHLNWEDEREARRVALIGWEMSQQLFGARHPIGESITIAGVRFTIVGRLRRKDQDSSYSGPDNNKIFIPFAVMSQILPIPNAEPGTLSQLIVAEFEERLGCHRLHGEQHASPDRLRTGERQLLADDDARKTLEAGRVLAQRRITGVVVHQAHVRTLATQCADAFAHLIVTENYRRLRGALCVHGLRETLLYRLCEM